MYTVYSIYEYRRELRKGFVMTIFDRVKNTTAVISIENKRIRVSGKKLISTWEGVRGG